MNQVKETKENNFFLINIVINALSSELANFINFLFKNGHSAYEMIKSAYISTISTNNIHIMFLPHHLKSFRGHSSMLSS
jgi:hypothetical protein